MEIAMSNMVQYSVFPNCQNNCKFCLRRDRDTWDKDKMIARIKEIEHNIKLVDWKDKYKDGISLMGGEIFFIQDEEVQDVFLELINLVIEEILIPYKKTKISTVTNGIYEPNDFLFKAFDIIKNSVGIDRADINVSYDIKYRFDTEERRLRCLKTINEIHNRYNYNVGVQTILTQYFIDAVNNKIFDIKTFEENEIKGCQLTFLYPHPINPLLPPLDDFKFSRNSFLEFMTYLKKNFPRKYDNFYLSTINSAIYKETGVRDPLAGKEDAKPILSDGKEIINNQCNHSTLYQCYSDCNKCMLCDLLNLGR